LKIDRKALLSTWSKLGFVIRFEKIRRAGPPLAIEAAVCSAGLRHIPVGGSCATLYQLRGLRKNAEVDEIISEAISLRNRSAERVNARDLERFARVCLPTALNS
jgi:hypothetical protein